MSTLHPSDARAQRAAEPLIISAVASHLGIPLRPTRVDLGQGVRVEIDGASADLSVLVEAYAHVGELRGAQPKKLATDAYKLVWTARRINAKRLIIAVADSAVEAYLLRPKAWLTAALQDSQVEVIRVSIDADAQAQVVEAQRIQFR